MRAIIQRVSSAMFMSCDTRKEIRTSIVALIGVEKDDAEINVKRMAERLLAYPVFPDSEGHMNLSLSDIHGELLLVPNFPFAADTAKGTRASFSTAAAPVVAEQLFMKLSTTISARDEQVKTGIFGANMQISLTNDGPVTFILNS